MTTRKRPLHRSIIIGCVAFILTLCVLLTGANLTLYRNYVYNDYREYIAFILNYTLGHIDGDDLEECIETLEESDSYRESLRFMDELMDNFEDIHYFYAIRPLNEEETGNMLSVLSAERYYDRYVDPEGNLYLGWVSEGEFDAATARQFMKVMEGEDILYFQEKTEWGTDYTGAVAIRNSRGRGVAVLAVDIDISFIDQMVREYAIVNICILLLVGLVFITIFLFWSSRNITRPIRQLEESAVGFVDHSGGQRDVAALSFQAPEIPENNEIKSLSDAVVKMTQDMRDYVTEIVTAEKKAASMQELARRDALTGIRNKAAYDQEIRRLEAALQLGETHFGLAIVDLNYLKAINDSCGHDKGDVAIQALCRMVCTIFKHSSVFRIGGDEFAVILRGGDYEKAGELTERLNGEMAALAEDARLAPWERVSAAIGVAFYDPERDEGVDSLFRRADHAMYDRKKEMKALRQD